MAAMKNVEVDTTGKKVALLVVVLSSFMMPYMMSAVNIALPAIGEEFKLDAVLLGWVQTANLLAAAISLVPLGKLGDILGRKKIFLYGNYIVTAASLLAGLAPSSELFIFFRVMQGIGASMTVTAGVAILTSVYPASERGRVLGVSVAMVYVGLSAGPTLGGLMTQYLGWRSIFLIAVPVGLVIIMLVLWKLKGEWAEAKGEHFDLAGSIIYGLALSALIFGLSLLPAVSGIWLMVAGIGGIIGFIWWEMKVSSPVLNIELFRDNRVFALSNLAALINYGATYAISFLLSLFLQYIKGFTPTHAGLILLSMPIVQAAVSPFAGRLSDRIDPRMIASSGMVLLTLGLLLFIFLNENTALTYILAVLILLGLGYALFVSPNTNAIMGSVDKKYYGVASGTTNTMRTVGQLLSMGIATLLIAFFIGRTQITPEYHSAFLSSMRVTFIIFTVMCLGGVFASLARGKVKN